MTSTPNTFDALKHYVSVRLQQGVPLFDADWNEMEDIRRYELRSFMRWFVGDGVPQGNDGFRITEARNAEGNLIPNNFRIVGGDGTLKGAGRCLVDGIEARLEESSLLYTEQQEKDYGADHTPLWVPYGPPTNKEHRYDLVYLDVWEEPLLPNQTNSFFHPEFQLETCARIIRKWVVHIHKGVDQNTTTIPSGIKDAEHGYFSLARIRRKYLNYIDGNGVTWNGEISQDDITDLRRTGVGCISREITIKNGNIGIGTLDPNAMLQIGEGNKGGVVFVDGGNKALAWNAYYKLLDTTDKEPWKFLSDKPSAAMIYINYVDSPYKLDDEEIYKTLSFYTASNNNHIAGEGIKWAPRLTITSKGYVGIGTNSPVAKLDVSGGNTILDQYLELRDYDSKLADGKVRSIARDGNWMFWNGGVVVGQYSNGETENVEDGSLIVKGKVGIGTPLPKAKLHILCPEDYTLPPLIIERDIVNLTLNKDGYQNKFSQDLRGLKEGSVVLAGVVNKIVSGKPTSNLCFIWKANGSGYVGLLPGESFPIQGQVEQAQQGPTGSLGQANSTSVTSSGTNISEITTKKN